MSEPSEPQPMTDGRLEELRSIADVWPGSKFGVETVDELLAEVDRLRAVNKQLLDLLPEVDREEYL